MLLLFLLQAAAPEAIVVTGTPRPQGLFTSEDYPRKALRHGWQGNVGVDLTVGTNGRVRGCRVTESSGHEVLDDATCKIVSERARFMPAQDAAGKPVESHYSTHIDWRIAG
jgi:protein TonB